jgi:hypothetical protein
MVIWLRDCVQRSTAMQVGGGNSSPVYGIDTKRVGRFTLEERRQLLQRFQQKRAQRNFNKKIKVDLLRLCSCNVKLQCDTLEVTLARVWPCSSCCVCFGLLKTDTCTSRCFGVIFLYNLTRNFYSTWSDGLHPNGHQCCAPSLLCRTLCASGLDACLFMGRLKWNGANSHKLANWMRILLTFFLATASWMLAIIKTEFSCCFQKCGRNSGYRFRYNCLPGVWADYYILISPSAVSCWRQWGVMASSHCHWWWRRWSLTFWVTFASMRAVILVVFVFIWLELAQNFLESLFVESCLQSHRYIWCVLGRKVLLR